MDAEAAIRAGLERARAEYEAELRAFDMLERVKVVLRQVEPVLKAYYHNLATSYCEGPPMNGADFDVETIEGRRDYADTVAAQSAFRAAAALLAELEGVKP